MKYLLLVFIYLILFSGCSNMLPELQKESVSQWKTYNEIEESYKKIIPYSTTKEQLHSLGFDPYTTANIKVLNYLDIMKVFLVNPSIKISDLEPPLQKCLSKKKSCIAYELYLENINKKRYGNVLADLFNFRKKTHVSGWDFYSLIIIDNLNVVYKIYNGNPSIFQKEDQRTPLGPFQSMESILRSQITY